MTKNLASLQTHPVFSEENYLDFERFAQERHEFLDGSVYAMAGESLSHSTVCFNLYAIIGSQIRGKRCRGFSPNMKIATNEAGLFSYPDLAIVCGTPIFLDEKGDVLTNPTVIFEVLSPSTENYDRGEKFLRYTNYIETLEDYVLISQDRPLIEHYPKHSGWGKTEIDGLDAVLKLDSVECEIALVELYDLVEFPA
jgi:Uma2 family endonuclease